MRIRNPEKYVVNISKTERHKRSTVPFLQRLLNEDYLKQKKDLSKLLQVNNGVLYKMPPSLFENILSIIIKDEHAKYVEELLCKAEEELNVLRAGFEEEKNRLETRIQKLSAFVDNFMTGSDCQDKFVKVNIIVFPSLHFSLSVNL